MHGLIRRQTVTDAARHDGGQLREGLITRTNTSRSVWADSACRSVENEAWLGARGMVSRIHRKKPRGRPMPKRTRRANAAKSVVRSKVEHVFARQKARMGMTIRTIGLARARAAITLANIACNMTRWRWLDSRAAPA
jgi:transposase, IS5 family